MHIGHLLTVMVAAFVAGAINSIAGGGTLVSFPALLGIGLTGQQANVTSTLALWPGSMGGFWGHREDLAGIKAFALRLLPVAAFAHRRRAGRVAHAGHPTEAVR